MTEKRLKPGFTTGAAAAAAARAALILLVSGKAQAHVGIRFLNDEHCLIPIHNSKILSPSMAESVVEKDAGDDPDVTHRAEIGARVSIKRRDRGDSTVTITGGKGVGVVTKPGLEVAVGQPAINSGPRTMICEAVNEVLGAFNLSHMEVKVEIVVPEGEALAKKTLNARLGILGGISILGTTGIVRPMSHEAYIATIRSGISVAGAMGCHTLVFTTGRRSERFAMDCFPGFSEEAFVQIGDFFKASLDAAEAAADINEVIITVFFGKAVKMAMGFAHTHAARSELTMKTLSRWALECYPGEALAENIARSNTARHALTFILPDYPDLIRRVGENIQRSALGFSHGKLLIRAVIFDFNGEVVFDSDTPKV